MGPLRICVICNVYPLDLCVLLILVSFLHVYYYLYPYSSFFIILFYYSYCYSLFYYYYCFYLVSVGLRLWYTFLSRMGLDSLGLVYDSVRADFV